MLSRRGFLIGAGSLTASFVKDARAFVERTSRPLLATPDEVAQTIYWYDNGERLLLTLGEYQLDPPSAPTWREFFLSEGIAHTTEEEESLVCDEHLIQPDSFEQPMNDRYWQDYFDLQPSPTAKAFRLLGRLDLGPTLKSAGDGAQLVFQEGSYPGDDSRWVEADDKLALSLLQARLIDLKLPIAIAQGS